MLQFSLQKKLHTATGEMQLNINCEIKNGEFISIYGASGVGKTSVLRMLAGFLEPENGLIKLDDETWFDKKNKINATPQQRKIGFVFQDYALFPNMSVRENIAFSLAKNDTKNIVEELLQLTGLQNLSDRKIQNLSGGQQQRVALARAIASKPKLLLLDEPLSAIDNAMREQLQEMLLQLHKRFNLTTILVSHDIEEIVKLSDKIVHLENGIAHQFNSSNLFLKSIGYLNGLVGNILSIEENGNIALLMQNTIWNITLQKNDFTNFKNGDLITITYDENMNPSVKKFIKS